MGILFTKLFDRFFRKPQIRIVMLGLDTVGKSTILYKLGKVETIIPTIGFNLETVEYKNAVLFAWDIGGSDRLRILWRHYYRNTQGIIIVVDSTDKERIEQVKEELQIILKEEQLRDAALLIFSNKQDLPGMNITDVCKQLELSEIKTRQWFIQNSCALNGEGIDDGFDWILKQIENKSELK